MAKPINLYQGPAPGAMSQMGAGLAEAGANIGRSLQQGYQSLGQGLAGGISAVADAYKKHKEEQARFDATKKMYKAFEGYLPENQRAEVQGILGDTSMSVEQKNQLAPMLMNMLGQAQTQKFALELGAQEQAAAMGRTMAGEQGATERTRLGIQARAEELGGPGVPVQDGGQMSGAPFYDKGFAVPEQQPVNPFKSALKKRHFKS